MIFEFSLSFLPSAFSLYRHSVCCEWKQSERDGERENEIKHLEGESYSNSIALYECSMVGENDVQTLF